MQNRRAARPDFELDCARVGEFLGQRNLIPAEVRHAHIDTVKTVGGPPAGHDTGRRCEFQFGAAGLFADQRGDAAHAVAAGAGFGAVIVVDTDRGILGPARRIERH